MKANELNEVARRLKELECIVESQKDDIEIAEHKAESAEEKNTKEVEFLDPRVEGLEISLNQATVEKLASAKNINIKTSFIMDLVTQLAIERGSTKRMFCLAKQNKSLISKLESTKEQPSINVLEAGVATATDSSGELQTESSLKSSSDQRVTS
ncbi:hypothetical protein HAX54_001079 [Datura stramonium]|uniref:Uncharacterized protein n=1 Tax=Datura stramonium TaxID=4076 RepID=A0ABS8WTF9_DATST|nr:hypothetical protein [Datura stramonium]